MVVVDVATQEHETCPESIFDMDELLEVGVGGVMDFAQPDIADSNVQGVVVPHTSGDVLGSWCHVLGMTKVASCLVPQRIADVSQRKQERISPRMNQHASICASVHIWEL